MSFAMIVYLIGMLDPIGAIVGFIFGSALFVSVICGIAYINNADDATKKDGEGFYGGNYSGAREAVALSKRVIKYCIATLSICSFLAIIIPSKETAYVMVAAYGVEGIVLDDRVQQLGGKSLDVIEQWLDEMAPAQEQPQ